MPRFMPTLQQLRQRARLTQVQLADKTHLEQPTISALELGKVPNPRMQTLARLARGLGVELPVVFRALTLTLQARARRQRAQEVQAE
jgi:transcriptional regulator with XRE-family HTH domain